MIVAAVSGKGSWRQSFVLSSSKFVAYVPNRPHFSVNKCEMCVARLPSCLLQPAYLPDAGIPILHPLFVEYNGREGVKRARGQEARQSVAEKQRGQI